jgi:hypothetical protein
VCACAVLLLGIGAIGPAGAGAAGCPDVMFLGARGSGEPATKVVKGKRIPYYEGVGWPLDEMAGRLGKAVAAYKETFDTVPIDYTAASVDVLVPSKAEIATMAAAGVGGVITGIASPPIGAGEVAAGLSGVAFFYYLRHLKPYTASIDDGVAATIKTVDRWASACPETELVLAGYSQGAMAVHQAELKLDDDALDAIGGTLLLGDGDRVPHTKAELIGGASRSGQGVRIALKGLKKPKDVAEPETTVEICVPEDIVCDFVLHKDAGALPWYKNAAHNHTHYQYYPQEHVLDQAVDWLAREMGLEG